VPRRRGKPTLAGPLRQPLHRGLASAADLLITGRAAHKNIVEKLADDRMYFAA
jgi:hypothetical protein